jgi:methylmalonyl-CoA mutase C-terminal domain/subunit
METDSRIRVLIAKAGLDGHDRGAKVVARSLAEAGMDVIYTGIRQTPEDIIDAAVSEDVDVLGLSIFSGAHLELFPRILRGLKEKGLGEVVVLAGGIIPDDDVLELKKLGIRAVYGPGTPVAMIAGFIRETVPQSRNKAARQGPVKSRSRSSVQK